MFFKFGKKLKYILGSSFLLGNVIFKSNHRANKVVSNEQNKNYQDAIAKSRKILFDKKVRNFKEYRNKIIGALTFCKYFSLLLELTNSVILSLYESIY